MYKSGKFRNKNETSFFNQCVTLDFSDYDFEGPGVQRDWLTLCFGTIF